MSTKITITYTDSTRPQDVVKLGAFAQIAAKRRFGLAAIQSNDPEPMLFGVFVEIVGPQAAAPPEAFDEWLMGVDGFEIDFGDAPAADPPVAATSTPSSPDSPPTSDSTP